MVRGINRSAIFKDDRDKSMFLERLGRNVSEGKCAIYAWVLMDNHVHLLFRSGEAGISSVMRKLLTWYAQYFNRRHKRTGHLFENRYKSILCDEDVYLITLVRYIHLNPLRSNIVETMDQMDHYPWSGHCALLGQAEYSWMDVAYILAQFGDTRRKAIMNYRQFVGEEIKSTDDQNFSGGGLVRSLGGWSQVLAVRRKGQLEESDERILGSGAFVSTVLRETEERHIRQLKFRRSGDTISRIIEEECKKAGINFQELKYGSRRSAVSRARAIIARRSRDELGLAAAEIARHLGVATSSITRAIDRVGEGRE